MRKITPTIFGVDIQSHMVKGKAYVPRPNTTLNERFNISVPTPTLGLYPRLKYVCLGRGGHANVSGADGFPMTHLHQHEPVNAAAFIPMPWVLRLQTNDLPPERQVNYALRRAEVHGTQNYWAYYAKRYDFESPAVNLNRIITVGGVEQPVPYVPNSSNLNPVPPAIPADSSIPALPTGDAIDISSVTTIRMTQTDLNELLEVARIVHNDERYAVISEVLLCTGIDVPTTVPTAGGVPMNFTEAAYTQVFQFITQHELVEAGDEFKDINVDIGASESLLTTA